MKTVGILGGMGPAATADFYARLTEATAATRDQEHLRIIIDSCPQVPDRTAFLLGHGPDPTPMLVGMARGLERFGAGLLVIACNTASAFIAGVAAAVAVPVVDWPTETASEAAATLPGLRRIGILATTGSAKLGMFVTEFGRLGVDVLYPTVSSQARLMDVIQRIKSQGEERGDLATVWRIGSELGRAGADAVLLACTELSLLHRGSKWPLDGVYPTLDSSQLVAQRVVSLAGAQRRITS